MSTKDQPPLCTSTVWSWSRAPARLAAGLDLHPGDGDARGSVDQQRVSGVASTDRAAGQLDQEPDGAAILEVAASATSPATMRAACG
ncbi:MAG: hypothetical protein WKG00_16760 [Polyangiaceae bacterium]